MGLLPKSKGALTFEQLAVSVHGYKREVRGSLEPCHLSVAPSVMWAQFSSHVLIKPGLKKGKCPFNFICCKFSHKFSNKKKEEVRQYIISALS